MRNFFVLILTLTAICVAACGQGVNGPPEANEPPEVPEQSEQPRPAEEIGVAPTDEERLRALSSDAAGSEVAIICLRLRTTYASGSIPADLRQQCAQSMLNLAEISGSTSKSADEWLSLAAEFGARSAAIKKTRRSNAARRSERSDLQAGNSGTTIENEAYANREDVRQAKEFLAALPEACRGSRASASRDGTVTIRVSCEGNNKSMSGSIRIKDGIVTEIQ